MNGVVVAFLIGALAGVAAWMIFAEAHRDMESLVRSFPSRSTDVRIEHPTSHVPDALAGGDERFTRRASRPDR